MHGFDVVLKAGIVRSGQLLILSPAPKPRWSEHDLPGGKLEYGEDPLACLHREVREETGLSMVPVAPVRMWTFTRDNGRQVVGVTFACEALGDETVVLDPREHRAFEWRRRDEIPRAWPEFAEFDGVFEVLSRASGAGSSTTSQYAASTTVEH